MQYGAGADRGKQNWAGGGGGQTGGTASQAWEQSILQEMAWELASWSCVVLRKEEGKVPTGAEV